MQKRRERKVNNAGFTLLEVLVAMIILAVVSVPLIRSFATATRTNRRAKIEMQCTNAAENLAEIFRDSKVEDLITRFSASTENTVTIEEGKDVTDIYDASKTYKNQDIYTFQIKNQDDMNADLPDGYYAEVVLDSSYYPNANGLNLSQIEPVSIKDSAIYTMDPNFDKEAYKIFLEKNKKANAERPGDYGLINTNDDEALKYLKDNLTRKITIVIDKRGEADAPSSVTPAVTPGTTPAASPAVAEKINLVKVSLIITYQAKGSWADSKFYPADRTAVEVLNTDLFDNSTSLQELNSVYLFFYPRYKAASNNNDEIVVENIENIDTKLYLSALTGATDEGMRSIYTAGKHQRLTIIEEPEGSQENAKILLRTNLVKDVPYSQYSANDGTLLMNLTYKNFTGSIAKTGTDAQDFVRASNIDGKTLDKEDTPKRIYKMTVSIYDDAAPEVISVSPGVTPPATSKKPVVEFDGTKLEY